MSDREPNKLWNVDNAPEVTRLAISCDCRSQNSEVKLGGRR